MAVERLCVLVTAVGGDLGQAVCKALRLMSREVRVVGCDASEPSPGRIFVDTFHRVPPAGAADYVDALTRLCDREAACAVIPASEPEMQVLSRSATPPVLAGRIPVVCQDAGWLSVFSDKLACYRALDGKVPLARFGDGEDPSQVDRVIREGWFPCVVKARVGSGSKTIRLARDEGALRAALAATTRPVIQEWIGDEGGEFSVGVYAGPWGLSSIAFLRSLGPAGNSWWADNRTDVPDVCRYAEEVARAADLKGSCNVQVRRDRHGIRLLEINARFSSLTAARAACGFRDLEWSLLTALGEPVAAPKTPFRRLRFQRFFHEAVDFGDGFVALAPWAPIVVGSAPREEA